CGGRISGKSASGSPDIAISPVITVRIAITIATIGRLIKKFEIIYLLTSSLLKEQVSLCKEQVRKRGLPPPLLGLEERGQAPLPDLFFVEKPYCPLLLTYGFGDTVIPGLTFSVPSATIDSPGLRPSSTTHIAPLISPSITARMLI